MSKYPEHDKLKALEGKNEIVGAFLEWLGAQNIELCTYRESGNNGEPAKIRVDYDEYMRNRGSWEYERGGTDDDGERIYTKRNPEHDAWGEGHVPVYWINPQMRGIHGVLAAYFGIDEKKLEQEKRQMLDDWMRVQEQQPA